MNYISDIIGLIAFGVGGFVLFIKFLGFIFGL